MVEERESSSDIPNPVESLSGRNYVLAETFFIRNGSSDKEAREKVRASLSRQGITDPIAVSFYTSEKERIGTIVNSLKNKKALASNDPWMGILGFDADQLQKIFETISVMIIAKDPLMEGIDAKHTVIFLLNANYPTKQPLMDQRTGLRLVALKKGEQPAFPIDPIPDS